MTEPTTAAGRDMLASHGYARPVTAEWIAAIEAEAAAAERAAIREDIWACITVGDVLRILDTREPALTNAQAAERGIALPGVDFPASADPDAPYRP